MDLHTKELEQRIALLEIIIIGLLSIQHETKTSPYYFNEAMIKMDGIINVAAKQGWYDTETVNKVLRELQDQQRARLN